MKSAFSGNEKSPGTRRKNPGLRFAPSGLRLLFLLDRNATLADIDVDCGGLLALVVKLIPFFIIKSEHDGILNDGSELHWEMGRHYAEAENLSTESGRNIAFEHAKSEIMKRIENVRRARGT